MAEARDFYGTQGGTQDVRPALEGGARPFSVRADPNAFGGQVAAAKQEQGKMYQGVGHDLMAEAVRQQGMINETAMTEAEMKAIAAQGEMTGNFKSLTGMAAHDALPGYLKDLDKTWEDAGKGLTAQAKRGFDMARVRHSGYAINEANVYAATQVKAADKYNAHQAINTHLEQLFDPNVAKNDYRLGQVHGDLKNQIDRITGIMKGVSQNPDTGEVSFTDTPEGRQSAQEYKDLNDEVFGQAAKNRFMTLAQTDGAAAAQKQYEEEKDTVPKSAQVDITQYLTRQVYDEKNRGTRNDIQARVDQDYRDINSSPENLAKYREQRAGLDRFKLAVMTQESRGKDYDENGEVTTSPKGARYAMQVMPSTALKPGYGILPAQRDTPEEYNRVGTELLGKMLERYPDMRQAFAAYNAGATTVDKAIKQSGDNWLNDMPDETKDYVDKVSANYFSGSQDTQGEQKIAGVPASQIPVGTADYYRHNFSDMLVKARELAEERFPGDEQAIQGQVDYARANWMGKISQAEMDTKTKEHTLTQASLGYLSDGKKPTTMEDIYAMDPSLKDTWVTVQSENPQFARGVEAQLITNAKKTNTINKNDPVMLAERGELLHQAYVHPEEFVNEDLSKHAGQWPASWILSAQNLQLQIRNKGTDTGSYEQDAKKNRQIYSLVAPMLKGFPTTKEGARQKNSMLGNLFQEVKDAEEMGGKPITGEEVKGIASDMLGSLVAGGDKQVHIKSGKWYRRDKDVNPYEIPKDTPPGDVYRGDDETNVYVPAAARIQFSKVPKDYQSKFSQYFMEEHKRAPTAFEILKGYKLSKGIGADAQGGVPYEQDSDAHDWEAELTAPVAPQSNLVLPEIKDEEE